MRRLIIIDGGTAASGDGDIARGGWAKSLRGAILDKNPTKERTMRHTVDILADRGRTIVDVAKDLRQSSHRKGSLVTLVMAVGVDDAYIRPQGSVSEPRFAAGLQDIANFVSEQETKLVVVGPQPTIYKTGAEQQRAALYAAHLAEIATATIGMEFVDTAAIFSPYPDYQVMDSANMSPNALGHELLFHAVKRSLEDNGTL